MPSERLVAFRLVLGVQLAAGVSRRRPVPGDSIQVTSNSVASVRQVRQAVCPGEIEAALHNTKESSPRPR